MSVEGEPKRPRTQGGDSAAPNENTPVSREAAGVQQLFNITVAAQTPLLTKKWRSVFAALSSAKDALRDVEDGVKGTIRPIGWAKPPPPADSADGLPPDVCRDVIYRCLPIDEAVCSARPTSRAHGSQLVNEAFCCYALEYGGAVWCEWPDFIRLADIYKLTPSTGLPLIMSPQWMAAHLPTKADFHTMPLALRQYSTFGHLLNYKGTSLAITKVDEAEDDDEEGEEEDREGDGGVTRQRYRIGSGEHEWRFETVPLSAIPPHHPCRRTYDPHNPPIRYDGFLVPSFTAFMKHMVLLEWCESDQKGVVEKKVFRRIVGRDNERFRSLLTDPIDGHTTIDFITETGGERGRFIILKGMKEGDIVAASLMVASGHITYTNEAEIGGRTRLSDRFPIAMSLAYSFLGKHGVARIIPQ
ncbi:unnamed protein product [Vitrella brassicaformis CCMP3155]|uniref:Uncharacterized protein n=1 Tax=Vitrella brassicaformis (strain CCMP3155) TaxID=1169540 RepID=A0A0G4FHM6_VITBC|nr:unnamed protein product [Vitrella brassicaformis CCMP3155]|eukprot:CEM12968.1 unnamed protein product [Vitrella brassicaformis CCMP3155]